MLMFPSRRLRDSAQLSINHVRGMCCYRLACKPCLRDMKLQQPLINHGNDDKRRSAPSKHPKHVSETGVYISTKPPGLILQAVYWHLPPQGVEMKGGGVSHAVSPPTGFRLAQWMEKTRRGRAFVWHQQARQAVTGTRSLFQDEVYGLINSSALVVVARLAGRVEARVVHAGRERERKMNEERKITTMKIKMRKYENRKRE